MVQGNMNESLSKMVIVDLEDNSVKTVIVDFIAMGSHSLCLHDCEYNIH